MNDIDKSIKHNSSKWRVATNRHTNTDGTSWGRIDGTDPPVYWSNTHGSKLTREQAGKIVAEHNAWLEAQRPLAVRLMEARERVAKIGVALGQAEATVEGIKAKKREAEAAVERLLLEQVTLARR